MATAEQKEPEQEVTKTVTILGYMGEAGDMNERQWADKRNEDKDYYEREEYEYTDYYMVLRDEKEEISEERYKTLQNMSIGEIGVEKETYTKDSFGYSPSREVSETLKWMLRTMEFDLPENYDLQPTWKQVKDENGDRVVNFYTYLDTRPLLKHPSKITDEDPYEDEETDYAVMRIKVKISNVNEEGMEMLTEKVIEPLVERMAKDQDVERVRWTDCKVKREEEGACLNI